MKRLFSVILSITMLISLMLNIFSFASDLNGMFQLPSPFTCLYLNPNYMSLNMTDMVIPEDVDGYTINKVNLKINTSTYLDLDADNVTKTLTYNKHINNTTSYGTNTADRYELARFKALKEVRYLYDGADFTLQSNLAYANDSNYSDSITDIYIYAQGITKIGGANVFRGMNSNLKVHVTSETIKQQILSTCGSSKYYPIKENQILTDLASSLPKPVVTLSCEDITYGTVGGFKPSATVKVNGSPIEGAKITYDLYRDQSCTSKYSNGPFYDHIPADTYYLRATVEGTSEYTAAVSDPLEVHVTVAVLDKTKLDEAIKTAESFKSSAVQGDYTESAWDAVFGLSKALDQAKTIANDNLNRYTQTEVEEATKTLNEAMETLKSSIVDTTELWTELQGKINDAEALDKSEYIEESYAKLEKALKSAKALSKDTATKTQIQKAITDIDSAIEGLEVDQVVLPAGKPFAYVYYNYTNKPFYSGTTDESMKGANRIKLTFDCAEDTSFNSYFDTNYEVDVDGTKSENKIKGTVQAENLGEKGCTAILKLSSPIEAGKKYSIIGYTYGYPEAKDYVFGITKIEFLDETGHILKTITDATVAKEEIAKAIEKAEGYDAKKYTAESYAELTKAIEAAKALKDDATAEEITAAKEAIESAIKALKEKPISTTTTTKPTTKPAPTTTSPSTKTTRSMADVKKDKAKAKKLMKQAKITKLNAKSKSKKKVTVSWKKVKKAKGYQVQVSAKKNFKKVIYKKLSKKNKLTVKSSKLKSKKTYYIRVRAYTTYKDKNGKAKKVYSKWAKAKKVKVK